MTQARLVRSAATGIAGGLAAAWTMNQFQTAWNFIGSQLRSGSSEEQGEPATVKAADQVAVAATGQPVPEPARETAGEAVHYGFGAFLGGTYGVLGTLFPRMTIGFGTGYGVAVFLLADELVVPAAGLSPPPQRVPLSAHAYSFASHLVFGAALEVARRLVGYRASPARA